MAQAGLGVDDAWVAMSAPGQDSIRLALHRMLPGRPRERIEIATQLIERGSREIPPS